MKPFIFSFLKGSPLAGRPYIKKDMRKIIQDLNKRSLSEATQISYSRLRKYAAGEVPELRLEEIQAICNYLEELTQTLKNILNSEE